MRFLNNSHANIFIFRYLFFYCYNLLFRWFLHGWVACQLKVILLKQKLSTSSFAQWLRGRHLALLDCVCYYNFISGYVFGYGFSFLVRSDSELLGPNNQYLPKIVSIFAEVSFLRTRICFQYYIQFCTNVCNYVESVMTFIWNKRDAAVSSLTIQHLE